MRAGPAALLVGAAALALVACQRAFSPAAAKRPTFACSMIIDGKAATCMQFTNVPGGGAGVDRLRQGCLAVPGQSFGAACPTDGLVGCCTTNLPDGGNPESCYYKGGPLAATPEQCAKDGGRWSPAP